MMATSYFRSRRNVVPADAPPRPRKKKVTHHKMSMNDKRMLEREALRSVIQQWNANRLDLFECSEPNESLEFHGVMRFYFQDLGQKVATKCIRVASDATVSDVIETLIEKFRPDMRMLSLPNYALYEVHANGEERKLNPDEKPLLVQLNWHVDDREGRFLLRNLEHKQTEANAEQPGFKRKLSKREKKEQKKKEKLSKLNSTPGDAENHVAEKLYTELPETSFTRSISNPEAVMRRRRQQKLEKKLQQFRSRDGGPDTGGTLKIYGESLCRDVPYKTLLLSIRDCAQAVVREMLAKYGMDKVDPLHYCLVQVNSDGAEYILDDDECPLSILMNHPTSRGSIMFHVRRRPADSQPRRRKKKPLGVSTGGGGGGGGSGSFSGDREGPMLVEITHTGEAGRRIKLHGNEPIEVGSANTNALQLFGPSIQARHCLISLHDGVCTVTPLHADALTFVNGHHISQPTVLHNGSVVMFGRVASYRFHDVPTDGRYNLALSQSQLDSACLYESRSPTSPTSWNDDELQHQQRPTSPGSSILANVKPKAGSFIEGDSYNNNNNEKMSDIQMQQQQQQQLPKQQPQHSHQPGVLQQHLQMKKAQNEMNADAGGGIGGGGGSMLADDNSSISGTVKESDSNVVENETKSISSVKSAGSINERSSNFPKLQPNVHPSMVGGGGMEPGQEPILPAVLEFPETHQDAFLRQVISELDVNSPNFKLAPVYTLYLCARYRASTHYRPDLQPTERAHKLTVFLHRVAALIQNIVQDQYTDPKISSFWMANSSEFLHFLKSDRHISAFSVQAQEVLADTVQAAFRNLVSIFHAELSQTLNQFLSENIDHDSAAGLVLSVLGSAMALLRRCRVNAALTIQLFSQLFHYINVVCFNKFVTTSHMCTSAWGKALSDRLSILELWAEKQGLELAADCHLAKINQCAQFLQSPKTSVSEVQQLVCSCFRLNSLQMGALLSQETIPRNLIDAAVRMAESVADELTRADGREVRLEESADLPLALLLPDDGFSCDVVRGIPAGLVDFLTPFQGAGMCRLASQPTSVGLWTVYMHQFNGRSPSVMSSKLPQPETQVIKLHKNSNGMGLSIVAAKGAGQERLGIYIKSVVPGGAADLDGRLQAGDQLLRVDGQSLIGITQERAADYLVRTGVVVTLEIAKQGAIYHGLATLLQQPSPVIARGNRRMSERDMSRIGNENKSPLTQAAPLPNSKSVPALHHVGNLANPVNKSRSIHNLAGNGDQGFYQNLSVYRTQNQSQPNLGERPPMPMQPSMNSSIQSTTTLNNNNSLSSSSNQQQQQQQQQQLLSRPASAYFNSNNSNNNTNNNPNSTTPNSMSYVMPLANSSSSTNVSSQLQQQQLMQQPHHRPPIMGGGGGIGGPLKNNSNFVRDSQQQHSLRSLNQMMAPSMPNIAHSSGYATNISASQSMQNVNVGNYPSPTGSHHHPQQQQQMYQHQHHDQSSLMRGQAKMVEMEEMIKRRNQQQQQLGQMVPQNQFMMQQQQVPPKSMLSSHNGMAAYPPPMQQPNPASAQLSPHKQLPPTAPKPQRHHEDLSPPLPPTSTHPLFKTSPNANYVASTAEAPKQGYLPPQPSASAHHPQAPGKNYNPSAANPWDREEREKDNELRRDHIRHWRDQQIAELSSLGQRTPQQEDQLKTLMLERDFERRVQEEEGNNDDDQDVQFQKEASMHEMVRLTNQTSQITAPMTRMKQVDIKTAPQLIPATGDLGDFVQQAPAVQPKSILKHHSSNVIGGGGSSAPASPSKQPPPQKQQPPVVANKPNQPNLSEITMNNTNANQMIGTLVKDMSGLVMGGSRPAMAMDEDDSPVMPSRDIQFFEPSSGVAAPPPPPERNSSYLIMSQQQHKLRSSGTFQHPVGGLVNSVPTNNNTLPNPHHGSMHHHQQQQQQHQQQQSTNHRYSTSAVAYTNSVNNNYNASPQMLSPTAPVTSAATSNNDFFNNKPLDNQSPASGYPYKDNKRVSFHNEQDNNNGGSIGSFMGSTHNNINNNNGDQAEMTIIREDPNRFIDETSAMLLTPTTPETENWNAQVQHTPGVIGAQEVYRDPRTRQLAEKQKQTNTRNDAVPEKLSFKEKMKMFALDAGENQTPKDKLKISRAQRDIDAVH